MYVVSIFKIILLLVVVLIFGVVLFAVVFIILVFFTLVISRAKYMSLGVFKIKSLNVALLNEAQVFPLMIYYSGWPTWAHQVPNAPYFGFKKRSGGSTSNCTSGNIILFSEHWTEIMGMGINTMIFQNQTFLIEKMKWIKVPWN